MLSRCARTIQPRGQTRPFITVVQKYMEAVKRYGWRDTLWKLYNPGDVKFGQFVGEDRFGNKYYEDPTEVHGQQRWCEFKLKSFDPIDASQIPPEWHMWLQQITDAKPSDPGQNPDNWEHIPVAKVSHAPYKNHVGPVDPDAYQENMSTARARGYNVGSLMTKPGEPDKEYIQPNHALRSRKRNAIKDLLELEPLRDPSLK